MSVTVAFLSALFIVLPFFAVIIIGIIVWRCRVSYLRRVRYRVQRGNDGNGKQEGENNIQINVDDENPQSRPQERLGKDGQDTKNITLSVSQAEKEEPLTKMSKSTKQRDARKDVGPTESLQAMDGKRGVQFVDSEPTKREKPRNARRNPDAEDRSPVDRAHDTEGRKAQTGSSGRAHRDSPENAEGEKPARSHRTGTPSRRADPEAPAADANEADGGRHKSRSASRTARSHSREQGGQGEVHQEPREGRGERERVREGRTPRRQPSDLETGPAK
jgi:hypothetical protein